MEVGTSAAWMSMVHSSASTNDAFQVHQNWHAAHQDTSPCFAQRVQPCHMPASSSSLAPVRTAYGLAAGLAAQKPTVNQAAAADAVLGDHFKCLLISLLYSDTVILSSASSGAWLVTSLPKMASSMPAMQSGSILCCSIRMQKDMTIKVQG